MSDHEIERRSYGATPDRISVLGFGGVIVTNTTPADAARYVSEAVDHGINYFDVAPFYGNAQERLGPALEPYRENCFLACKTKERSGEGAQRELEESLELLRTDRFDLYQLHALRDVEKDVEAAFAPGGAMDIITRARDEGKIRYIGFSAHTEETAHAAMDRFDFDSILFPVNYFSWTKGEFGSGVVERAREKGMGVLALKSLAHRPWTEAERQAPDRPWPKCWYKPLDDDEYIRPALRFTLSRSVDAAIPPGHWELFKRCVDIARERPADTVNDADEFAPLAAMAAESSPLFVQTHV